MSGPRTVTLAEAFAALGALAGGPSAASPAPVAMLPLARVPLAAAAASPATPEPSSRAPALERSTTGVGAVPHTAPGSGMSRVWNEGAAVLPNATSSLAPAPGGKEQGEGKGCVRGDQGRDCEDTVGPKVGVGATQYGAPPYTWTEGLGRSWRGGGIECEVACAQCQRCAQGVRCPSARRPAQGRGWCGTGEQSSGAWEGIGAPRREREQCGAGAVEEGGRAAAARCAGRLARAARPAVCAAGTQV